MLEGIEIITDEFDILQHTELLTKVDPAALQELVCELFFADMRKHNPMPSIIEYWWRRSASVLEGRQVAID